jgi:hypothetical protein
MYNRSLLNGPKDDDEEDDREIEWYEDPSDPLSFPVGNDDE